MPADFSDDSQIDEEQDYSPDHEDLPFLSIHFVQQVDELVSLAHYGPSIVLILGEDGIGKTCTLEQLENETREIGQIRIDGESYAQHRSAACFLLQQLNNYEQAVEYNSVRDSLLRASEISEQLILVDDAQQLSTSVLESLISLVSPIEQSPAVPVRLFLFGNQDLRQQLKMDSFPQTAVYCMELKGFEKDEISSFLGQQLNLSDDDVEESFDNKSLSYLWKESHGNPGKIIGSLVNDDMELEDVEEITRNPLASIILRSLLALLGVALLLLALFGEKWFGESWLQGETTTKPHTNEIISLELDSASEENIEPTQAKLNTDTLDASLENVSGAETTEAIAEQIPTEVVQRKLSEALLNEEAIDNNLQANSEKLVQQEIPTNNTTTVGEIAELPIIAAEPKPEITSENNTVTEAETIDPIQQITETSATDSLNKFTDNENYLLEQSASHYSVQLVGLSNFQEMKKFKQTLSAKQPLYIYRSLLNGNPWYILVTGNYPDADTARTAKDKFNPQLKRLSPWIKSFAKIQNEIKQAAASK